MTHLTFIDQRIICDVMSHVIDNKNLLKKEQKN